jgi:hypothetical protein
MTTPVINGKTEQLRPLSGCACNVTPHDIRVHIVESDAPPGGVGKPGVAPFAPALCNAIFAAMGERISRQPIGDQLKYRGHLVVEGYIYNSLPYRVGKLRVLVEQPRRHRRRHRSAAGVGPWNAGPEDRLSFAVPVASAPRYRVRCSLTTESTTMTLDDRTPGRS